MAVQLLCCGMFLPGFAGSILVRFPSNFFSVRFTSIHVVHPHSRIDTITAWKKFRLILSTMIDSQSIVVHIFARRILISLSLNETMLTRYMNFSSNFREPPFRVEMSP